MSMSIKKTWLSAIGEPYWINEAGGDISSDWLVTVVNEDIIYVVEDNHYYVAQLNRNGDVNWNISFNSDQASPNTGDTIQSISVQGNDLILLHRLNVYRVSSGGTPNLAKHVELFTDLANGSGRASFVDDSNNIYFAGSHSVSGSTNPPIYAFFARYNSNLSSKQIQVFTGDESDNQDGIDPYKLIDDNNGTVYVLQERENDWDEIISFNSSNGNFHWDKRIDTSLSTDTINDFILDGNNLLFCIDNSIISRCNDTPSFLTSKEITSSNPNWDISFSSLIKDQYNFIYIPFIYRDPNDFNNADAGLLKLDNNFNIIWARRFSKSIGIPRIKYGPKVDDKGSIFVSFEDENDGLVLIKFPTDGGGAFLGQHGDYNITDITNEMSMNDVSLSWEDSFDPADLGEPVNLTNISSTQESSFLTFNKTGL